jgi:NAD(P)-dependent dehydrogenase (short-subunit alcohol dehydrogenase family)
MRRLGELHELIGTMLYLASDHAKSLTGQTLLVDGGWTADHYL